MGLIQQEAALAANELNNLILIKFDILEKLCRSSSFVFFEFRIQKRKHFSTLSKIAFRLYPICGSKSGTERIFSRLKWKYPNRRSRTNQKLMVNEMHIDNAFISKLNSSEDFKTTMWQLPPHNPNNFFHK